MIENFIQKLTDEIDLHYSHWSFVGSIVDWFYFRGQVLIKDFDIITSDMFDPGYLCPFWGPRSSFKAYGRSVDVFQGSPTQSKMPTIEERIESLEWLVVHNPRGGKNENILRRYYQLVGRPSPITVNTKTCPNRLSKTRTAVSEICGSRGASLPVFGCRVYGECTHRQVYQDQKGMGLNICIGCDKGPWPFT